MSAAEPPFGGLSAAEWQRLAAALSPALSGRAIRDVARLDARDDLLLFVDEPIELGDGSRSHCVLIATGGERGRVCPARRRYARHEFRTGPLVDRLRNRLVGRRFVGAEVPIAGERVLRLDLDDGGQPSGDGAAVDARERSPVALVVEGFGPRGLWALLDAEDRVLELSRLPTFSDRTVAPGERYTLPAPRPDLRPDPDRIGEPFVAHLEAVMRAQDERAEADLIATTLERALTRHTARTKAQRDGLTRQIETAAEASALRRTADLLLAYGFQAPPGTRILRVPDPERDGAELALPFDPDRPVPAQAAALYDKAKRREQAAVTARERLPSFERELARLAALEERLADARTSAADGTPDLRALGGLLDELRDAGIVRSLAGTRGKDAQRAGSKTRPKKGIAGERFRRFHSAEGFEILVGRDNRQNDRLSVRYARGNDLWFHVGRGQAGSHVVVRVPKGRNASLETLLDAATLAVHFSKSRGAALCEVIYTHAKHVRKPKGLPPGRVLATQTRELRVRLEDDRLRRVLATAAADADD
jgi:predicted ribosome quality control (RQC) complex YloA/Tae2 family protein